MKQVKLYFPLVLIAIISAFFTIGCQEVTYNMLEPEYDDGKIVFKISNAVTGEDLMTAGEINLPINIPIIFEASTADSVVWTFNDGGVIERGNHVIHTYTSQGASTISVRRISKTNVVRDTTITVNAYLASSNLDLVRVISHTPLGNNTDSVVIGILKEPYRNIKGSDKTYYFKGSVTTPPWNIRAAVTNAADTNYLYNGKLYIVFRLRLAHGFHEMGSFKINENGTEQWVVLAGSPFVPSSNHTMLQFTVSTAGVTPGGGIPSNEMPGVIGDNYLRFSFLPDRVLIFTRHTSPFANINGFTRFVDSLNRPLTPISQSAVSGFDAWGVTELMYSNISASGLVYLRYGPSINSPNVSSENQALSDFYNSDLQVLQMVFQKISFGKSLSGGNSEWTVKKI